MTADASDINAHRPYTLVAELTYRCPLRCAYCSNPVRLNDLGAELDTATWARTFQEAEALGVMQVNLTGGEPLVRDDLESLVMAARAHDLYTTLITSGVPLSRDRLAGLRDAGLDVSQDGLNFSLRQQGEHSGNANNGNRRGTARSFPLSASLGIDAPTGSAAYRGPANGRLDIRV